MTIYQTDAAMITIQMQKKKFEMSLGLEDKAISSKIVFRICLDHVQ